MATESKAAGTVQHLDHFVLPVMAPERAEKFYTEILGARVLMKQTDPNMTRIFLKLGENHIGLFSQTKATIPKRDDVDSYPRCAFVVPKNDFDKVAGKVRSTSPLVRDIAAAESSQACGRLPGVVFTDSEGNLVELFPGEREKSARVHHLHFDTTNLEESIRFYTDILNLKLLQRAGGVAVVGIPADQSIVLHQVEALSEVTQTVYRGRHYAFYVMDDDFHAIVDRLHQRGIEERDEHGEREGRRPGQLGTYFKDPSGFRLQIVNQNSAEFSRHAAARAA